MPAPIRGTLVKPAMMMPPVDLRRLSATKRALQRQWIVAEESGGLRRRESIAERNDSEHSDLSGKNWGMERKGGSVMSEIMIWDRVERSKTDTTFVIVMRPI